MRFLRAAEPTRRQSVNDRPTNVAIYGIVTIRAGDRTTVVYYYEKSGGRYTFLLGSLYLILQRLEEKGLVTSRTQLVGKKLTRRYYKITPQGEAHLQTVLREYDEICKGVNLILDREASDHD